MDKDVVEWLLQSDPVVVFQTKRDLLDAPETEWMEDRLMTLVKGWTRDLLDQQDPSGTWAQGLYTPKFTSTHYTLMLLRRFEVPATDEIHHGCKQLLGLTSVGFPSDVDHTKVGACVTGMGLSILAHFQYGHIPIENILSYLTEVQLEDGGWNCRHPRVEVRHSSMHTTLSVLEGLRELARNYPDYRDEVVSLRDPAHEFLLLHELFKSHTTGEVIHPDFIRISFPPRWKYNILSALDYFRSVDLPYDERMSDAVELVRSKERKGYWNRDKQMSGKRYFALNPPRKPSPFNTLRALRVIQAYGS